MGLLITHLNAKVLVAGHPGSRTGLSARLAKLFPNDCQFAMLDPIASALPIIAAHSLVIAADSSISHLSAHLGVSTISLFGPNDPTWRRPLGKQHTFVRHKTECAPCLLKRNDLRGRGERHHDEVSDGVTCGSLQCFYSEITAGGASTHFPCSVISSIRRETASSSGMLNFTAVFPT